MMRGQAFDTFKLMIAAVVAVAILGILLAILGGISLPGQDPATMIRGQLQQAVQYPGSTFVSQTEASFKAGVEYSGDSFKDVLGGAGSEVYFYCADSLGTTACSTGSGGSSVTIAEDFNANIKAKCGSSRNCCVGIGDVDSGQMTQC